MKLDNDIVQAEAARFKAEYDRKVAESEAKHTKRRQELQKEREARFALNQTNTVNEPEVTSNLQSRQSSTPSSLENVDPLQASAPKKHKVKKESETIKKEPSEEASSGSRDALGGGQNPSRPGGSGRSSLSLGASQVRNARDTPNPRPESSVRHTFTSNRDMSQLTSSRSKSIDQTLNGRSGGSKRPADSNATRDGDRAPKAPRRPSQNSALDNEPAAGQDGKQSVSRSVPDWYRSLPKPTTRRGGQSNADISLSRLKDLIRKAIDEKKANRVPQDSDFNDIRDRLHTLTFLEVDGKLLRSHQMLHENNGLSLLFESDAVPWDVRADAEELYNKWCTGEFETDIYRGIIRGKAGKKDNAKSEGSSADKLGEASQRFRLMNPKQHGNGRLLNGAWWPSQLAASRDGAHGSSMGGITGSANAGAYSVIMAGGMDPSGKPYPNEDGDDEVLYCGTDNRGPEVQPSIETQYMLQNEMSKQPVRLIRSHNLQSPYAPELGFRYDGLYQVVSHEQMDPPEVKRCRYRFKLLRCPNQDPVRGEGPQKRPTVQEVEAYEKDKKNRGR